MRVTYKMSIYTFDDAIIDPGKWPWGVEDSMLHGDLFVSGTASASSIENSSFTPDKALDGSSSTRWNNNSDAPSWWRCDLRADIARARATLLKFQQSSYNHIRAFDLDGWDGTEWVNILSDDAVVGGGAWSEFELSGVPNYLSYRIYFYGSGWMSMSQIELWGEYRELS